MLTLEIPEAKILEWVQQLSPAGKNAVLHAIVPRLDALETMVVYGEERIQTLCRERGLDWEHLTEAERQALIDQILHEPDNA
jgi:hypothetical protein